MRLAALVLIAPMAAWAELPDWDGHWVAPGDRCEDAEPHVFEGAVSVYLKTECTVTHSEQQEPQGVWHISTQCHEDLRDFTQDYALLMTVSDRMFIWYGEEHSYPLELERCD